MFTSVLDVALWALAWYGCWKFLQRWLLAFVRWHFRTIGHDTAECDVCSARAMRRHMRQVLSDHQEAQRVRRAWLRQYGRRK